MSGNRGKQGPCSPSQRVRGHADDTSSTRSIPEVRHFFPNVAKYEEGPEARVTALLVTEKNNVYYRHATRAAREPGDRAALVFNLDCVDLTEKEVQEHFKAAIKTISKP